MKRRPALLWLLAAWACAACATVPVAGPRLDVTVTPDTIYPGTVVSVRVLAPADTVEVTGRLDWAGSPVVPLKTADQGRTWTFVTQIPWGAVWQPGRYKVLVSGRTAAGESLRGEAWVNAP
ncbi:MAG: hypothetical protein AB1439_07250 [candidate division FCPU426 bacterium]